MNSGYYFISDVHLNLKGFEAEKIQEQILIDFFDYVKTDAAEIFIVGDLFDFWIEYKYVVPKGYYKLFTKISEVVNKNIKITYLAGNHDFWRGTYFSDEFGITIIDKNLERQINGKKFFISHGDGLAYKDTGYRIMKKILRNKISQKLYSVIHPDLGIWLAKRTSSTSRTYTGQKDYSRRDGLKDFAVKKIASGFDFVIMGHRHKPLKVEDNGSYYINLGDWIDDFSYGLFKGEEFKLMKFFDLERKEVVNEEII